MSDFTITRTRIAAGKWEGLVTGPEDGTPELAVSLGERQITNIRLEPLPQKGRWALQIDVPADAIAEGLQAFVIADSKSGEMLDSFVILAGSGLQEDIRAEVELLRAELDMLKRAFRRHCLETS